MTFFQLILGYTDGERKLRSKLDLFSQIAAILSSHHIAKIYVPIGLMSVFDLRHAVILHVEYKRFLGVAIYIWDTLFFIQCGVGTLKKIYMPIELLTARKSQ